MMVAAGESRLESAEGRVLPLPGEGDWHFCFKGRRWRYDRHGVYLRDGRGGERLLRSVGEPVTCQAVWQRFGSTMLAVAGQFELAPELLVMTVATESAAARRHGFTGPATFRWEPHVWVRDVTPSFQGDYSAGPLQTLATTARWVIQAQRLPLDGFQVAPVIHSPPVSAPLEHPLYRPEISLMVGAAVIKQRWEQTGADPVLVAAAFNAGGIYRSTGNPWHLASHGDHLDRAAAWYGDACAVLQAAGVRS
ncbi:MAG: hypothetical protein HQL80_07490 [Magnetococcales bacterium]|nr:hypothetical protein [Magnetococcales bacterium]